MNKTEVVPKYLYVLFSCRRLTVNVKASNTNDVMKIILQQYEFKHIQNISITIVQDCCTIVQQLYTQPNIAVHALTCLPNVWAFGTSVP